jgi:hypothetical protein
MPEKFYQGKIKEPLLEGVEVVVAGQSFVVPPSNIKREKLMIPDRVVLEKNAVDTSAEQQIAASDALTHIALVALQPNYPELTADMLEEHLKTTDLLVILNGLRKANGLDDDSAPETGSGEVRGPQDGPTGTR